MESAAAFQKLARFCVLQIAVERAATAGGDTLALHRMRIAMTRLRAILRLFAPMVEDAAAAGVRDELRWLNRNLSQTRDFDVTLSRALESGRAERLPKTFLRKRDASRRRLQRLLNAKRFAALIEATLLWIERGEWTAAKGTRAIEMKRCGVAVFIAPRLERWRKKIAKASVRIDRLDAQALHDLRIRSKRLRYALEFCEDLPLGRKARPGARPVLSALRKAQKSLGVLNDDETSRAMLARSIRRRALPAGRLKPQPENLSLLTDKQNRKLLRAARIAFRHVADASPFTNKAR